jgi:hypothetical protein
MKKSFLALICLALLSFVGCKKDKAPTIKFITTGTYTNSTTELHAGEKATFGVEVVSSFVGGKGISKIVVEYSNGDEGHVFDYDPAEDSPSRSWVKIFDTEGKVTVTATAYDVNGETATATLTVTVLEAVHAPKIEFLTGSNYVSDGSPVYTETSLTFGVKVDANETSQSPITKIDVQYSNENGIFNVYDNASGETSVSKDWTKTFAQTGTVTVTATATDADGATASASISVLVTQIPGPDANPFIGAYTCNGMTVTGHVYASSLPVLGDFDDDINVNVSGSMVINAGATYNDVVVSMVIDGESYNIGATTNGNNIVFDQKEIIVPVTLGFVSLNLRAVLDGVGTLEGNDMDYNGVIGEQAYISINNSQEFPVTVTNGKMIGTFTKLAAK